MHANCRKWSYNRRIFNLVSFYIDLDANGKALEQTETAQKSNGNAQIVNNTEHFVKQPNQDSKIFDTTRKNDSQKSSKETKPIPGKEIPEEHGKKFDNFIKIL